MQLSVAGLEKNEDLLKFFHEFNLKSHGDFKISRGKNFFAPYQIHSEDYRTFCLEELGQLHAVASFLFKDTFFESQETKVGFAMDLRVDASRKAILQWSQHFLPVMKELKEACGVKYFFSAINLMDQNITNTFIRPRSIKRPMPRYYLYRKFDLISLHGRFPWAPKPLSGLRIRSGTDQNKDALLGFILSKTKDRPLTSIWDSASFERKLKRLNGLKISDFLIAFDNRDNVVGCLAPWSNSGIQDYIPLSYNLKAHNFRQFLKFGWLLGWSRRLAKPMASTGIESKLQFRHLTHLFANNEDIFESLVFEAFERVSPQEFLIYTQTEHDYHLAPPKTWIHGTTPFALYCLSAPDEPKPEFLNPHSNLNPEIESHLII